MAADPSARNFWTRVVEKRDQRDGDLQIALDHLRTTGALEATHAEALAWAARARAALDGLPDHEIRQVLADLSNFVVNRIT